MKKKVQASKYIGLFWSHGAWNACCSHKNRTIHLGRFDSERAAAIARDRAVLHVRGRRVVLNFPNAHLTPAPPEEVRSRRVLGRMPLAREAKGLSGAALMRQQSTFPWVGRLTVGWTQMTFGSWKTPEEAALARDRAVLYYYRGKVSARATLNFPKEALRLGPADQETLRAEAQRRIKESRTSRFRGVSWHPGARRWTAGIQIECRKINLGLFDDEEAAARAYDKKAIELLGAEAKLNFHPRTGAELLGKKVGRRVKQRSRAGRQA